MIFDGLIIAPEYIFIVAFGLTLACGLLLASGRRWAPPKLRACLKALPLGCALPVLFLLVIVVGLGWVLRPVKQPESLKTAAAYSVPLASEKDRNDFLEVLRATARGQGMHVDAAPREWLEATAKDVPAASMTIHAAVWKDPNDKEPVADVMDLGHSNDAWLTFSKGTDPKFNAQFRNRVMPEIMRRWPDTLSLPILPTDGLPQYEDLIRTPEGYKLKPGAASKYAEPKR